MPSLRKAIFNNQVHFITCSVEEGIMLPANPLVTFLIKAALVRAYEHYSIEICHFIVNGTHIHMIVTVNNPEDIPGFMERFKTESAHYLNRLLGRRKRTVWCDSYDSPALLRTEDVIEKIVYLYTNPVKDGLIKGIEYYPGLSSWKNYQNGKHRIEAKKIARDDVIKVEQNLNFYGYQRVRNLIDRGSNSVRFIDLAPDSWMRALQIPREQWESVNERIKQQIVREEKRLNIEIKNFKGRVKLENQGIELDYLPERKGKKMWCICSDVGTRVSYINFVKGLCKLAKEVYQKFKSGDFTVRYPPGLFAPRVPLLANLLTQRV